MLNLRWLNKAAFIILVLCEAFSLEKAFSQQYIANGDFETLIDCPVFWSQRSSNFSPEGWYSASLATPDVFANCSKNCNSENNWMDSRVPNNNGNYIGLIAQKHEEEYSEYVQTKLLKPLDKDSLYEVVMHVYRPRNAKYIGAPVHVLLSSVPINSKKEGKITASKVVLPDIDFDTLRVGVWEKVRFKFKATGNEKYLTIGAFNQKEELSPKGSGTYDFCYYFIDDVLIKTLTGGLLPKLPYTLRPNAVSREELLDNVTINHQPGTCDCWNCLILSGKIEEKITTIDEITDFELDPGMRVDLNKIVFDYETGELLAQSYPEMNRLLFLLTENPRAELRFIIYTYAYNNLGKDLAKSSAISIYQYLKSKGLQNSFSYIHASKDNLSQKDDIPRDRNIELYVVNN